MIDSFDIQIQSDEFSMADLYDEYIQEMRKVKMVFHSFQELGVYMGVTPKRKKGKQEKDRSKKCPKCGGPMHKIEGVNIWACGNPYIIDEETPEGTPCQVFGDCCECFEIEG